MFYLLHTRCPRCLSPQVLHSVRHPTLLVDRYFHFPTPENITKIAIQKVLGIQLLQTKYCDIYNRNMNHIWGRVQMGGSGVSAEGGPGGQRPEGVQAGDQRLGGSPGGQPSCQEINFLFIKGDF